MFCPVNQLNEQKVSHFFHVFDYQGKKSWCSSEIGKALLFNCLEAMKQQGYGYAIIGGVGPAEFYAKTVGAIPIEGSEPGVYRGLL